MTEPKRDTEWYAGGVLAQLRGVGPQTVRQISEDLGIGKREVASALWLLKSSGKVEYASANTPLVYKAAAS